MDAPKMNEWGLPLMVGPALGMLSPSPWQERREKPSKESREKALSKAEAKRERRRERNRRVQEAL